MCHNMDLKISELLDMKIKLFLNNHLMIPPNTLFVVQQKSNANLFFLKFCFSVVDLPF